MKQQKLFEDSTYQQPKPQVVHELKEFVVTTNRHKQPFTIKAY